jgi:hypothetical protein
MTGSASVAADEEAVPSEVGRDRRPDRLRTWNRKLHYYLGLYLLLFLWLFALSGLVLNHPRWTAGQFWSRRHETVSEHTIRQDPAGTDEELTTGIMRELALVGEPGALRRDSTGSRFEFQVVRPGRVYRVAADLSARRASVTEIRLDRWGAIDALHKLTGVRLDKPQERREWIMTRLWSLAMDALAIGLLVLVATGLYLWYRLGTNRVGGIVALALGAICCAFFLFEGQLF